MRGRQHGEIDLQQRIERIVPLCAAPRARRARLRVENVSSPSPARCRRYKAARVRTWSASSAAASLELAGAHQRRSLLRRSRPARPSRRADGARDSSASPTLPILGSMSVGRAALMVCSAFLLRDQRSDRRGRRCRCRRPWRTTWNIRRSGTSATRRSRLAAAERAFAVDAGEHLAEHRVEEHRLEILRGGARLGVASAAVARGRAAVGRRVGGVAAPDGVATDAERSLAITSPRCRPGSRRRP